MSTPSNSAVRAIQRLIGRPIPRYVRAAKVLFIEVPKNASVAFAHAIYGREVTHRTAQFYMDTDPIFFQSRFSCAIVRNPWDRCVSAYEFYRSGGTKEATPGEPPESHFLDSFETFVFDYLVPNAQRLNTLDDAIREQNIFVNDRVGNCLVSHLGRYENLDLFEQVLLQRGAIAAPTARLNVTTGRTMRDYRRYYTTPLLVDAIARCYHRDANQFAYEFE